MAMLAKAMIQHSEMKATPIITATFLNRPGNGRAGPCNRIIGEYS
jgi:hypothetical protein